MRVFTIVSMFLIAFSSCKKKGCTNPIATNYEEKAKKEDGSCTYEGYNVLWFNQESAGNLLSDGVYDIYYYVNGTLVDSSYVTNTHETSPNCGEEYAVTITESLASQTKGNASFYALDQDGYQLWNGSLNFEAGVCISVQLEW